MGLQVLLFSAYFYMLVFHVSLLSHMRLSCVINKYYLLTYMWYTKLDI